MSFEKVIFNYTPPKTVEDEPTTNSPQGTSGIASSGGTSSDLSRLSPSQTMAGQIITDLNTLTDTAAWLEQLLLSRLSGFSIPFDSSTNPEASSAFNNIFGAIPTQVSVAMYSNLLDAQLAIQVSHNELTGSAFTTNPIQEASITEGLNWFNSNLGKGADFNSALVGLLPSLKQDQVIYPFWASQLSNYPAYKAAGTSVSTITSSTVPLRTIDVSPSLAAELNSHVSDQSSLFASMTQLIIGRNPFLADLNGLFTAFGNTPQSQLLQVLTLLYTVENEGFGGVLTHLVMSITSIVGAELSQQAASLRFLLDRFLQSVVTPLENSEYEVGKLISQSRVAANTVGQAVNVVSGLQNLMPSKNKLPHNGTCGPPLKSGSKLAKASAYYNKLTDVNPFIITNTLTRTEDWAFTFGNHIISSIDNFTDKLLSGSSVFTKLNNRKQEQTCNHLSLLQYMQESQAISAGLTSATTPATSIPNIAPVTTNSAVSQILSNQGTSNQAVGTSTANNQVFTTQPTDPVAPANVVALLATGGTKLSYAS